MSKPIQISMIIERETKGAIRYAEVNEAGKVLTIVDGAKIGTLYVRKTVFEGSPAPQAIQLVISAY